MAYFFRKVSQIPEKLLITRTDRIGDFILSLPTFEAAKKIGIPHVTVLCREPIACLLDHSPYVDQVLTFSSKDSIKSIAKKVIQGNFDAILSLVNDPVTIDLMPMLQSVPIRIGSLSKLSAFKFYNFPVLQKRSRSLRNEAEYNLELLDIFKRFHDRRIKPKLYFTDSERKKFEDLIVRLELNQIDWENTMIIHSGMSGSALNWPLESYRKLAAMILLEKKTILLTGTGTEEKQRNETLQNELANFAPNILEVTDKFKLRELALLFSKARMVIGPSTGPIHLANAVETPFIALYPPIRVQSRTRWQPYLNDGIVFSPDVTCREKYKCKEDKCKHFPCMETITPSSVFSLVQKMLTYK